MELIEPTLNKLISCEFYISKRDILCANVLFFLLQDLKLMKMMMEMRLIIDNSIFRHADLSAVFQLIK